MFKAIGIVQLSLAPVLVLPALTGQDLGDGVEAQLAATLQSIDYLRGLETGVRSGDPVALRALERATEPARDATPQRAQHLETLQDDIARLRFGLDQLLADPAEVEAIMSLPPGVIRVLGLGGALPAPVEPEQGLPGVGDGQPAAGAVGPGGDGAPTAVSDRTILARTDPAAARPETVAGTGATVGLDTAMRAALRGEVGPLDQVRPTSRRRGSEPVPLEGNDYVADPVALGRLLVRSKRPAEAVEILAAHPRNPGARYWLARAYQQLDRNEEALQIYRALGDDADAGVHQRHAKQDLEFLEFKEALRKRRR